MLKKLLMASAVAIAVTAFGNMALAQSEEEQAKACDLENLVQSGTLTFNLRTIVIAHLGGGHRCHGWYFSPA